MLLSKSPGPCGKMSVCFLPIATSSWCSSQFRDSLSTFNKTSINLSLEFSLIRFPSHLTSKPKPIIKTHPFFPRAFDTTQDTVHVQQEEDEEEEEEEEEEEDDDDDDEIESQSSEAGRLYVGNLPYAMTSSQLLQVFSEAGRVLSVEIVYDRVTDRSRGFAFVTMATVEEAKEAIGMFDGSQVGGRTVRVNFPEVPKGGEREVMGPKIRSSYQGFIDSPHKLYAGNLSWGVTSQGLREAFAHQPGLLSTKVVYDRDSARSRGFGFITFASAQDAQSALNTMNGVELEGRPLRLNLAEERAPQSPSPTERKSENDV